MNEESNNKKLLRSDVIVAFAIGSVVASALTFFMSPINKLNTDVAVIQNQIAELKSNDLTHIELIQQQEATTITDLQKQISSDSTSLAQISVLLNEIKQQKTNSLLQVP